MTDKARYGSGSGGPEVQAVPLNSSPGVRVVADPPHECSLPGWRERRRLGVTYESTVECNECGQRWRWHDNYAGTVWMEVQ